MQLDRSSAEIVEALQRGNRRFQTSSADRIAFAAERPRPYAIVISCSDPRVVPELIFSAEIGDLFVVRIAGNAMGPLALDSVEFAVVHFGIRIIIVLGHTECGAVKAAAGCGKRGRSLRLFREIRRGFQSESNDKVVDNVAHAIRRICACKAMHSMICEGELMVAGAVYDVHSGYVTFFD